MTTHFPLRLRAITKAPSTFWASVKYDDASFHVNVDRATPSQIKRLPPAADHIVMQEMLTYTLREPDMSFKQTLMHSPYLYDRSAAQILSAPM
jgi:hypothetical protein